MADRALGNPLGNPLGLVRAPSLARFRTIPVVINATASMGGSTTEYDHPIPAVDPDKTIILGAVHRVTNAYPVNSQYCWGVYDIQSEFINIRRYAGDFNSLSQQLILTVLEDERIKKIHRFLLNPAFDANTVALETGLESLDTERALISVLPGSVNDLYNGGTSPYTLPLSINSSGRLTIALGPRNALAFKNIMVQIAEY